MKRSAAFAVYLATIALAGCSSPTEASPAASPTAVVHSVFATVIPQGPGQKNPEAAIPNPGTGKGNPKLLTALLPQGTAGRASAVLLPPAVVAMPDTNRESLFIGLRQAPSPVTGPPECLLWTGGLAYAVPASFNQPGVQLALSGQPVASTSGRPAFAETIVTGPPRVLSALADSRLPAGCRTITAQTSQPGGVRPLAVPQKDLSARAYEITGAGKVPVWLWAEVVRGPNFVLEIRVPHQSQDASALAQLPAITNAARQRAFAALDAGLYQKCCAST